MSQPRRKSRRVRMAQAIRRDCDPVLFGLGFRNPRRTDWERWGTSRRNVYIRWRGAAYDQIDLQWDKANRARFFLNFVTSHLMRPSHVRAVRTVTYGIMRSWQGPIRGLQGGWFGPWMSPDAVAALVNRRVQQLDAYLLTGAIGPQVIVGPVRLVDPEDDEERIEPQWKIWGDPWLDSESDYLPDR